jgi:hypothetical protein
MAKVSKYTEKKLGSFCEHYCVDVETLQRIAVRHFAEILKDHPVIELGQTVEIMPAKTVKVQQLLEPEDLADWWKKRN